jgi:topoisomerase IA-like protein
MAKYNILKTFRNGEKWYKQGDVEELTQEQASEFILNRLISPAIITEKPKAETATAKPATETATTDTRGKR